MWCNLRLQEGWNLKSDCPLLRLLNRDSLGKKYLPTDFWILNSKIKFSKTLILNSKEGKEVLWEQAIFQIEKEIEREIEKVFWNFSFWCKHLTCFQYVVKYWRRTSPEFYESKAGSKLTRIILCTYVFFKRCFRILLQFGKQTNLTKKPSHFSVNIKLLFFFFKGWFRLLFQIGRRSCLA